MKVLQFTTEVPIKFFEKKIWVHRAPDPLANTHKKSRSLGDSLKELVNTEMSVKKWCGYIREGSPTHYGGIRNVFLKINF
ncbi:hypothetical protein R3W88_024863 [Solanum pinnatisectum]|uniref:Uncharacterized protein n=1 Tax=Solanum pinnatisectum TaxID=50273 RepID=A0AAV9M1C5_9SOLN|nr:hypothetical protein R3W88_024863 [Solanum pinnatisectum]